MTRVNALDEAQLKCLRKAGSNVPKTLVFRAFLGRQSKMRERRNLILPARPFSKAGTAPSSRVLKCL